MTEHSDILSRVCDLLGRRAGHAASELLEREYPYLRVEPSRRQYGPGDALRVFRRDGYVDRYSGRRLVFPGALRLVSHLLPAQFPYHPNWKTSASHSAYWELYPTIDHVVPVSRGGADSFDNWVTTSMLRNGAKGNWTLEELGWSLQVPGALAEWDGLEGWFVGQVERHPELRPLAGVREWYRAVAAVRREGRSG